MDTIVMYIINEVQIKLSIRNLDSDRIKCPRKKYNIEYLKISAFLLKLQHNMQFKINTLDLENKSCKERWIYLTHSTENTLGIKKDLKTFNEA